MATFNQVTIIGYLGQNPELRVTADGTSVTNLSIATTKSWTDKITGEKREKTEWHRAILFGRLADIASQYLKTGSNVFVQGELIYRKWEDKTSVQHTTAEIHVNSLQMLGSNTSSSKPQSISQQNTANQVKQPLSEVENFNDIPF